jgi:sugar-specific transcriptional regulator TrmB
MSQDKVLKNLVNMGLTRTDAKIYVFLAKRGPQKAQDVALAMKIAKQRLYPSLRRLQSKGLVNATLEHPARFSALSFEKALDLFAKTKMEEAKNIQQSKDSLLSDWQSIVIRETEDKSAKFTVIEGRKYVYSKIQQMIQETKKQLSTVTTIPGLIQADQYGLLDTAFNHPLKHKIQFRFLTELSASNIDAINALLERAPKTGFNLKVRNPQLGLKLSPRMVLRDNEELLFFITSPTDKDTCLWTTCKELVQSFVAVFDELWRNSTDIEETICDIKKGETAKTRIFNDAEAASKKYEELLSSAEEEIIELTSSEGLLDLGKNLPLLKNCAKKGVAIKIMAPVTSDNFEVAKQLSKHFEVRHAPVSYLKTTIVDEKYLFQSRATFEETAEFMPRFQTSSYTNDQEYVSNRKKILTNLWKTSKPPSTVTLEKVTSFSKSNMNSRPSLLFKNTIKRIDGPIIVEEENDSDKNLTEKDIINLHLNAARHPETSFSRGITRYYGFVGQAIVRPPSNLNLPEMLFIFLHSEKNSRFETDDIFQVFVKQKSPGRSFLPVVYVSDNTKKLDFHGKIFAGCFLNDNFLLAQKDQIQIQMHGNNLFCGWTIEIPLIDDYILPPGSILLEAHGEVKPGITEMQYPSGYKLWNAYNGIEAFVTYFHPFAKYSGPGTDGLILRDMYQELYTA